MLPFAEAEDCNNLRVALSLRVANAHGSLSLGSATEPAHTTQENDVLEHHIMDIDVSAALLWLIVAIRTAV